MKKQLISVSLLASLAFQAAPALALQGAPDHSSVFRVPRSTDGSPVVALGTKRDPATGELVEGYAIVHYKKGHAKSGNAKTPRSTCYGYFASGAKWKVAEPWIFNGANTRGLDAADLYAHFTDDIGVWEDAGDGVMGNSAGANIFGTGALTTDVLIADESSPDNVNEAYFAAIDEPGAIAVTIVWGVFSGPTFGRKLIEWDQVYDDTDFDWSLAGEAGKMDFDNIATHELGHALGLIDIYTSSCSSVTMYGYASEGDMNKRTLESPDIQGVNQLY